MYVIIGATGKTGGVATRALLDAGNQVRAVGRDPDRLKRLAEAGAEAVTADVEDAASVERALAGATAAYVIVPPNFATSQFRAYQDRVVRALTQALRESAVSRIALLSSLGADHPSGTGPVVALHHFEQQVRKLPSLHVLSIRAGFFMENLLMNVDMVRSMGIFGMPAPADAPMTLIAAADIGRYAARRLAALDWNGFEVTNLIGPALVTPAEVAATIGQAIGKPDLPYVQFSYEDARQGMIAAGLHPELAGLYIELYQGAARGLLQPEAGTALVQTETSFSQFSVTFAAVYAQKTRAA